MKKDIEWLMKETVKRAEEYHDMWVEENENEYNEGLLQGIRDGLCQSIDLIDQLDEPEVLSSDWINNNSIYASSDGVTEEYVHVDDLQSLLVPKQELPVIPRFVAERIKKYKNRGDSLGNSISLAHTNYYLENWIKTNEETFARAWLDGYEVEEVQKYYIQDQHGVYLLAKTPNVQGKVQTVAEIVEYYGVEEIELDYELTEQEIKDYDLRYRVFRKPVEELEE